MQRVREDFQEKFRELGRIEKLIELGRILN